jgi:hypothetical protein
VPGLGGPTFRQPQKQPAILARLLTRIPPADGNECASHRHDTKAVVPVLHELADGGFQGPALGEAGQGSAGASGGIARRGDLGYRRKLAEGGQALGVIVEAIARGRHGRFILSGIYWVVERSFAWLSRYRQSNAIVERWTEHLIAFVAVAFISIPSRRLKRVVVEELGT